MNSRDWQITNGNLVLPDGVRATGGCVISDGRIRRLLDADQDEDGLLNLNLHGLAVYPGLVNAHDSLIATYHAFTSDNRPYQNWLAWDNDLKSSPLFRERMLLDIGQLYELGAYRNLISGVTSVADHIPHFVRRGAPENLPVHLLEDFGISHSICSYSLGWGEGPAEEYRRAEQNDLPYITHIAEGFDRESRASLRNLEKEGGLGKHSLLVHGLSLDEGDLDRIAAAGAAIAWCPTANLALYDKTGPMDAADERGINLCLGTDSAMTGSVNLMEEMRAAHKFFEEREKTLAPQKLFEMVTANAAWALRLTGRGVIAEKGWADLLVLRGKYPDDPFQSLLEADPAQVYLVVKEGMPVYGDAALEPVFTELGVVFDRIRVGDSEKIIVKGIRKLLDGVKAASGTEKEFDFLPVH